MNKPLHSQGFATTALTLASFLVMAVFASNASTVVVPNGLDTREGSGSSGILNQAGREQTIYASTNFPNGPISIQELHFRPNVADYMPGSAFNATIWDLQMVLSTTSVPPGGLSPTFADNTGLNAETVVSGAITLFSTFTGPDGGPKDFDIVIPLNHPFTYNPVQGNLLVDIQNSSGDATSPVDAEYSRNGAASRVVSGSPISTSGVLDNDADVLQMVYSQLATTNPPPTGPIILWQPGNETVSVGQTAVFTVVADSSVPLNYQWVFDGTNTLAGATNSSLSLGDVQPSEAGTYEVWVFNAAGSAHSMAAKLTVTPIALPGYITAVLRSECTDSPPPPRLVGEVATGPDYVIITVGLGDPGNWQNAQQLASDAVFESIMPLYCALPKVGCVTDSVQWNIITYDANGNPNTSGCAASGCQDHSCAGFESGSQVTNGYITAVLRSDCTSEPAPPAPVGATSFGPDYVIKTVADANPANLQYARQILTDAIFESLMPVYCALPENSGVGCVTNRVQWNIITYDTNGNPLISGCPTSGCGYHYCGKGPTVTTGPALTIASSINKLGLCWPSDATDFILEASSNLVNWYAVDSAVATNGGQMSAQVPAPAQGLFYRLHHK